MSDETRTTSSTGGQKGVKPQRYDLLPKEALDRISEVYAFGAEKYADHNWLRGYEWGKSYAALMRHLTAFWDGETNDPESGLPHPAHAGFHVFALLTWLGQQGEGVDNPFDDRWSVAMERARLAEEVDVNDEALTAWRIQIFGQKPGFHVDSTGEATEDYGARWFDPEADTAADIVTGRGGVQRSFDLT